LCLGRRTEVGPLGRRRDALTNCLEDCSVYYNITANKVDPDTTRSPNASATTTQSKGPLWRLHRTPYRLASARQVASTERVGYAWGKLGLGCGQRHEVGDYGWQKDEILGNLYNNDILIGVAWERQNKILSKYEKCLCL
jgi:hypothetical protein